MLNKLAKFLLVTTSLSPVLGAVAVNQLALERSWIYWAPWLIIALLLVLICHCLLFYASKNCQKTLYTISELENTDKEVLAFLLAYLLPFISSKDMAFEGQWQTGAYILLIIFLVITHAGTLHFNPVMGLFGYHFYSVKNNGISQLLISKSEIQRLGEKINVVCLDKNIYLDIGGKNA